MQTEEAPPAEETSWTNPTLPGRRDDIMTMTEAEWKQYRAGIVLILTSAGESDKTREMALAMLLEADRRLWINGLANRKYTTRPAVNETSLKRIAAGRN